MRPEDIKEGLVFMRPEDEKLFQFATSGDKAYVQAALASGASVDALDYDGRTPLHRAAEGGHLMVAELLLNKGANPTAKDNFDKTPVELATAHAGVAETTATILQRAASKRQGHADSVPKPSASHAEGTNDRPTGPRQAGG
jgi:hypothetical protein